MTEDSRVVAAMIGGAILGSLAGYLFFTERGRSIRREIEPAIEDFARELNGFRSTIQKAIGVASEGWGPITEGPGGGSSIH